MSIGLYIAVMVPVFIIAPLVSLGILRLYQGRKKSGFRLIGSAIASFALMQVAKHLFE
ncbi:hypothetical protein ABE099_19270 [Paenibacillus turicensis]|uniref:Uncharacterized protein n=1 Tax=Paenibacillus turicensis TaxID=160487 RepID=A0ABS4FV06_9BACL|nr:hypothetical protein [Paenibacillus turicensis]MBP1906407.1 hypothetical protein [Paenibacillus turicensis]